MCVVVVESLLDVAGQQAASSTGPFPPSQFWPRVKDVFCPGSKPFRMAGITPKLGANAAVVHREGGVNVVVSGPRLTRAWPVSVVVMASGPECKQGFFFLLFFFLFLFFFFLCRLVLLRQRFGLQRLYGVIRTPAVYHQAER
jgi:hypothetical protein